jgi:hypothetical protein
MTDFKKDRETARESRDEYQKAEQEYKRSLDKANSTLKELQSKLGGGSSSL